MTDDDYVRYTVQMPRELREDAKRNTERGELAEEVRDVFRQRAYGIGGTDSPSELDKVKAELRDVRQTIDDLRHRRRQLDAEIEAKETRATRLEERIEALEEERSELETTVDMLENLLLDGDRMWPTRIKNAADVDPSTAEEIYHELRDRNPDLPDAAFEEPALSDPADWTEA
jgi:predicted  nucleic acid-binding Zn-ribbon protein